jgi:DNA-binding transcriptional ArsR family regulator
MMDKELAKFDVMVRQWADSQPEKYRKSALAFGYPCNTETHSFSGTEEWIAKHARKNRIDISERTIQRHLKVFERSGVITVERRREGNKNVSSLYHVHFDKTIPPGDPERDTCPISPVIPDRPAMPMECYGHDILKCQCQHCQGYVKAYREWAEAHGA